FSAEAHRSTRVHVHEIEDRVRVFFGDIQQSCLRRVSGRLPVNNSIGGRRYERAADGGVFFRITPRATELIQAVGPVSRHSVLTSDQMLAGNPVQGKIVAVPRRRNYQL